MIRWECGQHAHQLLQSTIRYHLVSCGNAVTGDVAEDLEGFIGNFRVRRVHQPNKRGDNITLDHRNHIVSGYR